MTDFATLVLAADTRQLDHAIASLDGVVVSSGKAETAAQKFGTGVKQAGDNAGQAAPKLGAAAKGAGEIQIAMMKAAKALGVMAGGFASLSAITGAVTQARDFNAALAETSTLIKGTPEELAALSGGARDLAKAFGTDATSQMKAFYEALSGGAATVEEAQTLVEQANKLATGGVTSVQTAVDALTTSVNAYGASTLSFSGASDAMFVAVLAGKMTMDQLASSLGAVVPISSSAGVSFDETAAAIAALTTQGLTASTASTSLRQVLASVLAPTEQAKKAAAALGLQFDVQALQAKGLAGFLADVAAKTGGNQEAMAQLFGSVEALGAVLAFSGGAGEKFTQILGMMKTKVGATDAAAAKMAASFDKRLNRAMAAVSDIALGLGNAVLPIVVPLLEAGATAAKFLADHSDTLAVAIGAASAAYVMGFIPATYTALTGIGLNIAALTAMEWQLLAAAAAARALGAAMLLATPVGWVIGVGLIVAGIYELATASGKAASAQGIQAAAAKELDAALAGVNLTSEEGKKKATELAEASINAARADVLAARIKMANAEALRNMARPGLDSKGPSIAAMQAQKELDAIEAKLAGLIAEADALGLALAPTPIELARAAAEAERARAEAHRLAVEAGAVTTATVEASAAAKELVNNFAAQNEVARLAWIYGENSRQVAQAKHDIERASLLTQMQAEGVAADTVLEILRQSNATFAMQQALSGASGYAEILRAKLSYLASAVSPAIGAVWRLVAALGTAVSRLAGVAMGLANVAGVSGAVSAAGGLLSKGMAVVGRAFGGAAKTLGTYWEASKKAVQSGEELADVLGASGSGAGSGGGGVAGGAKAATDALTDAEKAAKQYADTMSGYVTDGIGKAVDWMVSGFKGGLKGLLDVFKSTIMQMVTFAIKNKIMIGLGMGGTGIAGAAAAATGGGGTGGGGLASGLLGKIGGFGASIFSGASGVFTSLFGAGGGLGAAGTYMSSVLGTATTSLSAFGSAVGAIAVPLLAVAGIFSFFKKKVTVLDQGFTAAIDGIDMSVRQFTTTKTTRFWGLSKKTRTNETAADPVLEREVNAAYDGIRTAAVNAAAALGIGENALNGFSYALKVSLQGLSEDQAQKAIEDAFAGMSDAMAAMILAGSNIDMVGKSASAILQGLAASLTGANGALKLLGFQLYQVSIAGGVAADAFVQKFGGLDAFLQSTGFYFENFYSDQERAQKLTANLQAALSGMGVGTMPRSVAEFRALVDSFENVGNSDMVAKLIQLAPALTSILDLQSAAMDQRLGLEERLLELQGRTSELRARELARMDPANRALQIMIWRLEDMQATLKPENFKTLFDYNKAVATGSGMSAIAGPVLAASAVSAQSATASPATVSAPQTTSEALLFDTTTAIKRLLDVARNWDANGMPPVRV